jgi:hypothetical protein
LEPHPGDRGSIILETVGASSYRHKDPHPGYKGILILKTEGASSWRQREPHPGDIESQYSGDIGILILET